MRLLLILASALLASAAPPIPHHRPGTEYPVRLLYQYPLGTWIENIAIRPNGHLLLTLYSAPHLDMLDPSTPGAQPITVHDFAPYTSVMGKAEVEDDVFTVAVGNVTDGQPVAGSWSVWKVDLTHSQKKVSKVTDLPEVTMLNGMCNLPGTKDILTGDLKGGKIWRVDTETGDSSIFLENEFTAAYPDPVFESAGVNGIHVQDGILYFTNTGLEIFAQVPISPLGPPSIISHTLNVSQEYDDFALSPDGKDAYLVTGSGNSIEKIGLDGTRKGRIVAGSLNSTQMAEPTSCAFGKADRDREVLYVVTAGGLATPVNGNVTVGGQVLAVDTREWDGMVKGGAHVGWGWKGEWPY